MRFHVFFVNELAGLLLGQHPESVLDRHFFRARSPTGEVLKDALKLRCHFLHARGRHDFHADSRSAHLHLDLTFIEPALAKHLAELLTRRARIGIRGSFSLRSFTARRPQKNVQYALLGGVLGLMMNRVHGPLSAQLDRHIGQIANDRFDVPTDVADLGELGRFDLDERRVGESRQAPGDLGLADSRGPDHENVFRSDLVTHLGADLAATPAVSQRYRHCTLRGILPDDVLVQLVNDFPWGHVRHGDNPFLRCADTCA